ncbi:hypothetical protein M378DRAFT_173060 [Amanita muscaria Koide BX008]|uniref:Uncharacterized protein n=1 Tax=Amanita muscaria (strain Koide BX008) TaxID=946122 RepID=A0A0C2WHC9_AMAMK|nr:hypothetical protein M378DRAFT_173060 [Amanita muscaria Koide BX008]
MTCLYTVRTSRGYCTRPSGIRGGSAALSPNETEYSKDDSEERESLSSRCWMTRLVTAIRYQGSGVVLNKETSPANSAPNLHRVRATEPERTTICPPAIRISYYCDSEMIFKSSQ